MITLQQDIALRVAWAKKHEQEHIDKSRERQTWYAIAGTTRRAERMRAAIAIETHQQWEWWRVFNFYGRRCCKCGSQERIAKDHIVPVSKGGSDGVTNLQPLCQTCNTTKHDRHEEWRWDNGEWVETVRLSWLVGE